jgi:hypothetical protein
MIRPNKDQPPENTDNLNDIDISDALSDFKARLNLNSRISVKNRIKDGDNSKVIVSYIEQYPIKIEKNNEEVYVSTPYDACLIINDSNQLIDYEIIGPDLAAVDLIRQNLCSGMDKGQIRFVNDNGTDREQTNHMDSGDFFIYKDKDGKNYLKRTRFT